MSTAPVLTVGTLAYFDSFGAGLVPCKVQSIKARPVLFRLGLSNIDVCATVTADRGPYKRGERIEATANYIVPRRAVKLRGYFWRILPFRVCDASHGPEPRAAA